MDREGVAEASYQPWVLLFLLARLGGRLEAGVAQGPPDFAPQIGVWAPSRRAPTSANMRDTPR